jgi:hypothetical protein
MVIPDRGDDVPMLFVMIKDVAKMRAIPHRGDSYFEPVFFPPF